MPVEITGIFILIQNILSWIASYFAV